MVKRVLPEAVILVSIVLKLLSTRLGSLVLCGLVCLDWKWPLIHKFQELPLNQREKILQKWSTKNSFIPIRVVFVLLKVLCCFITYSWVRTASILILRCTHFFIKPFYMYSYPFLGKRSYSLHV